MAAGQQADLIFKRVAVSERKMIFREAAEDKIQISVKGTEHDEIFHLIAVQVSKDENLLCHHTADSKGVTQSQKILINFGFQNERYFMQTELAFESGWAVIPVTGDLYQLQRRANARFVMPEGYNAVYFLTEHERKKYFVDCIVKDISAGGLKLEVPISHPDFRVGEVLKGSLRLGHRRPLELEVEVRFALKNETCHTVGVQFLNINHVMENRLLSLMMNLQQELFLKFPPRPKK